MCGIVLIQNSKGGGLAASFASSNQIMGVRKTTDFLEKATWTLAAVIAALCVFSAYLLPDRTELGHDSVLMENAINDNAMNPETLPGFDAPAVEESAE
jgi:preprotein translocase subunit SecG